MAYKTEIVQFRCKLNEKEKLIKEAEQKQLTVAELIRKKLFKNQEVQKMLKGSLRKLVEFILGTSIIWLPILTAYIIGNVYQILEIQEEF